MCVILHECRYNGCCKMGNATIIPWLNSSMIFYFTIGNRAKQAPAPSIIPCLFLWLERRANNCQLEKTSKRWISPPLPALFGKEVIMSLSHLMSSVSTMRRPFWLGVYRVGAYVTVKAVPSVPKGVKTPSVGSTDRLRVLSAVKYAWDTGWIERCGKSLKSRSWIIAGGLF